MRERGRFPCWGMDRVEQRGHEGVSENSFAEGALGITACCSQLCGLKDIK